MDIIEPPKRLQEFAIKIMSKLVNQQFKLIAIIVRQGKILGYSTNDPWKSAPKMYRLSKRKHSHAEFLVLKKVSIEKLQGAILYVFRLLNCKIEFSMSRPCLECCTFIRTANLKKIIYTTNKGTFAEMRI